MELAEGITIGGWSDVLQQYDFADPLVKVKDKWDELDSVTSDLGIHLGIEASEWPDLIFVD